MHTEIETSLREIGKQLDAFLFPSVKNGGIVVPSRPAVSLSSVGKEHEHAQAGQKRSATGSREGQPVWQRTSAGPQPAAGSRSSERSGSPDHAAPLVGTDFRAQYLRELGEVERAYPGSQHWHCDDCIWIIVQSALLPGVSPKANFAVRVPLEDKNERVRAWGFWGNHAIGFEWIGPRHTNFPDGSICAFEQTDQTWLLGDSLIALLDLYTLWALRHLHLRTFGRWPGAQAVHFPYERVLELRDDEYCGCASSTRFYGQCCKNSDLELNLIAEAIRFAFLMGGGLRRPPEAVVKFMRERREPPSLTDLPA